MVIVVHPGLAGIQVWWRDPLGAAIFAFPGGPSALFDQAVVGTAGQGEFGDVGGSVVFGPAVDVVGLTPVARGGAARPGAAAVERMQNDALSGSGEAFGAATVERFAGVFVVDHQIVIRL